jgi:hypothetical protein
MSEILSNEMMCAAEIMALTTSYDAKLEAMREANRVRHYDNLASAYGETHFNKLSSELEGEVDFIKKKYL